MKSASAGIGGFILGVAVAVVVMGAMTAEMYDRVIQLHVQEAVVHAELLRRGKGDIALSLFDSWLQGPQIKESLTVYIRNDEPRDKAYQIIDKYRADYEPIKKPDAKVVK